eukprot:16432927-Heterocapsa_arctica.AAC.1
MGPLLPAPRPHAALPRRSRRVRGQQRRGPLARPPRPRRPPAGLAPPVGPLCSVPLMSNCTAKILNGIFFVLTMFKASVLEIMTAPSLPNLLLLHGLGARCNAMYSILPKVLASVQALDFVHLPLASI